jgi:N-acetylmuramoyl-L-alanine amidase/uncharacterized protein YjdB
MKHKNTPLVSRVVVALLAFIVACTPTGSLVYAATVANNAAAATTTITTPEELAALLGDDATSTSSDAAPAETNLEAETNPAATGGQESTAPEDEVAPAATTAAPATATELAFESAVEYVYVENSVLTEGDTQAIVVGLLGTYSPSEATLTLVDASTAATLNVVSQGTAQGAYLFEHTFSEDELASWIVAGLAFTQDGVAYSVDFTTAELSSVMVDEDTQAIESVSDVEALATTATATGVAHYGFDVVSAATAAALEGAAEDEDGVSAYSINEEGALVAARSVDAALETAQQERAVTGREDYLLVAIDAGHGGSDSGATGNGLKEKDLTLDIANNVKNHLSNYAGVSTYMTRTSDVYVGLEERVNNAAAMKCDVFVSVHINSGGGYGVEVWVPRTASSYLYSEVAVPSNQLGTKICSALAAVMGTNRGLKSDYYSYNGKELFYADGSRADSLSVIRNARMNGMQSVLVECGFIDNAADASKMGTAYVRTQLGQGIATSVAEQYGLAYASDARTQSLVGTTAKIDKYGWLSEVYDNKVAGTSGKGITMRGLKVELTNDAAAKGGIQYRTSTSGSWSNWVSNNGELSFANGAQAVQLQLTGDAANSYDVYYRVQVSYVGWMGWAKNGETAGVASASLAVVYDAHYENRGWIGEGATGNNYIEAIEVTLVPKGSSAPGSTNNASIDMEHGQQAGDGGSGLRLEALKVRLVGAPSDSGVQVKTQVQNIGWKDYTTGTAGTSGQGLRLETFCAQLTGSIANSYDLYYRSYVQGYGWLNWAKNGEESGSVGFGLRIESVQMKLVAKGAAAPEGSGDTVKSIGVGYNAHVENIGWQSRVADGATAGTSGKGLRMEAFNIFLGDKVSSKYSGGIQYKSHIENYGWEKTWNKDGAQTGTTGSGLRLEAIEIELYGDVANAYDLYYRVHAENYGWLGWAKNGEAAGTAGYGLRLEAIEICLVAKGGAAPGSTTDPFIEPFEVTGTNVANTTVATGSAITWSANIKGATLATQTYLVRRGNSDSAAVTRLSSGSYTPTTGGLYQVAVEVKDGSRVVTSPWTNVTVTREAIMGTATISKDTMKKAWKALMAKAGSTYPAEVYAEKGAATIDEFIDIAYEQAAKEGVRADVVLTQIAVETGWLKFGGDVKVEQCNFGGIGATGNGNPGNEFKDVAEGIMANVQHLKAYASKEALKTECVDPRFTYVTRGIAPYMEQLAGKWAASAVYGISLDDCFDSIASYK